LEHCEKYYSFWLRHTMKTAARLYLAPLDMMFTWVLVI